MSEKKNVTYLIGAGASVEKLPLVKGIPDGLKSLLTSIDWNTPRDAQGNKIPFTDNKKERLKNDYIKDVEWLYDNTISHSSIDTYAKKLITLRKREELDKLKIIFTLYFLYSQYTSLADKRYDAFIAALLNHKTEKLPDHVKVLSWNYDIQFEKAMAEFLQSKSFVTAQSRLNVLPKNEGMSFFKSDFSLFKINGSGVFTNSQNKYFALDEDLSIISERDAFIKVLDYYDKFKNNNLKSAITFAWEEDDISKYVLETAMEKTQSTTILIVIGYSFPFFNRVIDRQILKMPELQKIYFQAPDYAINNIVQSFKSIREFPSNAIELITETEQFFLPPEL